MGFSPITAGSSITTHTHTNAAGDGGFNVVPAVLFGD
jgi:hypothetical protein